MNILLHLSIEMIRTHVIDIFRLLKVLENENVYVLILEQAPMTLEMLLRERCVEESMNESIASQIAHNILNGLKTIHQLGFVHKDIKPENILIFADRKKRQLCGKIADFGFATRYTIEYNNGIKPLISKEKLNEFKQRVGEKCGTPGMYF